MSVARITAIAAAVTMSCAAVAAGSANAAAQSYGTIAVSKLKNSGVVTAGNSKVTADAAAIRDCANYDCDIVFRFTDGCGALARGADGTFGWAAAGSREEAEAAAVAGLGQSNPPFPDLGSASPQAAKVVASTCTGNIQ
ncbi:DUF4189 domain-containing protein [Nocardia sp. NBC_01503]|uniref:DUF4189 domain-containing protein n=1 Tax=Nocardia sp. NBC_01503 TaxID=2975997 RepID=UPI002E7AD210|nr:DUF4189 domain-containing protein [Nocardia sp. NBC_01503]WTL33163.1 DUF4189 domain-containing protein [Nocardia sp. NBC_01503]